MLLIVLRHFRYVVESMGSFLSFIQPFAKYAGFLYVIGLVGLLLRRVFIDRVKYIHR